MKYGILFCRDSVKELCLSLSSLVNIDSFKSMHVHQNYPYYPCIYVFMPAPVKIQEHEFALNNYNDYLIS